MTRRLSGKLRPRRGRTSFIKLRRSLRRRLSITLRPRRRLPILLPNLRSITALCPRLFRIPRGTDKRIKKADALIRQIEMSMSLKTSMSPSTRLDTIRDLMDATIIRHTMSSQLFRISTSGATKMTTIIRPTLSSDVQ